MNFIPLIVTLIFVGIPSLILLIIAAIIISKKKEQNIKLDIAEVLKCYNIIIKNQKLHSIETTFKSLVAIFVLLIIIYLVCLTLNIIPNNVWLIILELFIFFIFFIILYIIYKYYEKSAKEEIISKIIKQKFPNLSYNPSEGLNEDDYHFVKFETYDKYISEDSFTGKIYDLTFNMAEVRTYEIIRPQQNVKQQRLLFSGIVAKIDLPKDINFSIHIINNTLNTFYNKNKITTNNKTFNYYFDTFSDNNELALRLLTEEVTKSMIDLMKKSGIPFEIKIFHKVMFFRFFTNNLFKISVFNSMKNAKNIAGSLIIIENIHKIMNNMIRLLNETDVKL